MNTSIQSNLQLGLINWYPFHIGEKALVVYANDTQQDTASAFVRDLQSRGLECECCHINTFTTSKAYQYGYILAWLTLETYHNNEELIKNMIEALKEDGHIFFACDNRLGLHYFAGDRDLFTNRNYDGIEDYYFMRDKDWENTNGRCYARYELLDILDQLGLTEDKRQGYSILPGLEMPQQIYSWEILPKESVEIRYTSLYHNPAPVFLMESKAYDGIINNDMFHQMANAYLIDCCKSGVSYVIDSVTTSMDRGNNQATATIIEDNNTVLKKALYADANQRIETLYNNTEALQCRGIKCVEVSLNTNDNGINEISMPYIEAPTAQEYLQDLMYEDADKFKLEMCRFLDQILQSSDEITDNSNEELSPIYNKAYTDMMPLNCFVIDGEYVFFDQEYVEENYPMGVVLARAIMGIYTSLSMNDRCPDAYFYDRYNLTDKKNIYQAKAASYILDLRNSSGLSDFNQKHKLDNSKLNQNRMRVNYSQAEYDKYFLEVMKDTDKLDVYVFGSGAWARKFVAEYGDDINIAALLDNNENVWGSQVDGIEIKSPKILEDIDKSQYKVIICIKNYSSIVKQLQSMGIDNYGMYAPDVKRIEYNQRNWTKDIEVVSSNDDTIEAEPKPYHIGYVAGVFDLFHIGHLNVLRRAKDHCDILLVGVVSDEQASKGKAHSPYVNEDERREIVEACKYVDKAFVLPMAASGTRDVYRKYHFDAQFSGSDYEKDPNWLAEQAWLREQGSELVFFPYTESTSSTKLKKTIEDNK